MASGSRSSISRPTKMWCSSCKCAIPSPTGIRIACMPGATKPQQPVSINLTTSRTTGVTLRHRTPTSCYNIQIPMYNNDLQGYATVIDRQTVLDAMQPTIGLPFQYQGRGQVLADGTRAGVDCIGLVLRVAWDVGLALEDSADYQSIADAARLTAELERQLVVIPVADVAPGDVVQWRTRSALYSPPDNVALVGWQHERLTLVAAVLGRGVLEWAYRLPGLAPWLPSAPAEQETSAPAEQETVTAASPETTVEVAAHG